MISKSIILHHKLVDPDKSNKVKPQWEKGVGSQFPTNTLGHKTLSLVNFVSFPHFAGQVVGQKIQIETLLKKAPGEAFLFI